MSDNEFFHIDDWRKDRRKIIISARGGYDMRPLFVAKSWKDMQSSEGLAQTLFNGLNADGFAYGVFAHQLLIRT